ncbi:hypothetical protein BC939DRAFT_470712 [Gamsiella multidivaricata]|uniref:uncharacterized protein n=1 Tax=Gamsiella multidivaricata TaxID=101098 RepID=UPI0022202870|nr:uncharacterized protein BC939DRAFT_470712 [Gamsiella multidivaricata]KAI7816006.1 hypothetical protein BC939DRAFT_470712 [Gamsiella multidivaricata]
MVVRTFFHVCKSICGSARARIYVHACVNGRSSCLHSYFWLHLTDRIYATAEVVQGYLDRRWTCTCFCLPWTLNSSLSSLSSSSTSSLPSSSTAATFSSLTIVPATLRSFCFFCVQSLICTFACARSRFLFFLLHTPLSLFLFSPFAFSIQLYTILIHHGSKCLPHAPKQTYASLYLCWETRLDRIHRTTEAVL